MADETKAGFAIPPTVWVAVFAALFGGFAARQTPFQDARPPELAAPVYMHIPPDDQDVEARLWEDPLAAVAVARAKHDDDDANASRHTLPGMRGTFPSHAGTSLPIQVIAALVPGAPYAEDIETRRRTRYAVLAGLYEGGYAPQNSEHVGYVSLNDLHFGSAQTPSLAAYEWFERTTAPEGRVLVLWMDQDGLGKEPLRAISDVMGSIVPESGMAPVSTIVLGPTDSDGLRVMSDELRACTPAGGEKCVMCAKQLRQMDVYSPRATASDRYVLGETSTPADRKGNGCAATGGHCGEKQFWEWSGHKVRLYRTVTTDAHLAEGVMAELHYRGIEPGEIVLIAERDTLYGQHMRNYFGAAAADDTGNSMRPLFFTYLRGLDGFTPPAHDSGSKSNAQGADSTSTAVKGPIASEAATGQGQLDYLRRLAASLAGGATDTSGQLHHVKAVGVLGSDVYDKIMVLQALRPALPRAVFFTTDLDARLLDSGNIQWTRQLLIASSLGLSLRPSLQGGVPPFRDTYQSATYFSVRLALNRFQSKNPIPEDTMLESLNWTQASRIFEIGRYQIFDLTRKDASIEGRQESQCTFSPPCASIAAPAPPNFSIYRSGLCGLVIGSAIAAMLAVMAWAGLGTAAMSSVIGHRPNANIASDPTRGALALGLLVAVVLAAGVLWPRFIDVLDNYGSRYPPPMLGGASRWSAGILEMVGILGVIALVLRGQRKLDANAEEIHETFGFPTPRETLIATRTGKVNAWPRSRRYIEAFLFSLFHLSADPRPPDTAPATLTMEELIGRYLYRGTGMARLKRVAPIAIVTTGIVLCIEQLYRGRPLPGAFIPLWMGSAESISIAWLALFSLVFMFFLVLWVADAMLLSRGFLLEVRRCAPAWPLTAILKSVADLSLPDDLTTLWLNLRLIGERTAWVAGFIWYPSVILVLMTLASLTVDFGQYDYANNPVALCASAALVILVAVMLRAAAEGLRDDALEVLDNAHLRALKLTPATAPQTQRLRQLVEELDEGAFAPFSQQPVVAGVILPLFTYGATALPAYLHLGVGT